MNPMIISFQLKVIPPKNGNPFQGYKYFELRCPWDGKPVPRDGDMVMFDNLHPDMKGVVTSLRHYQSVDRPTEVYVKQFNISGVESNCWYQQDVEKLLADYQERVKGKE